MGKNPERVYYIVRLNNQLYLESYYGTTAIGTTNKKQAFKFQQESKAIETAKKYGGEANSQYDWWS